MQIEDKIVLIHKIESISINDGRLFVSGYAFIEALEAPSHSSIDSHIVFRRGSEEFSFQLASIDRKSLTERFAEDSGIDYSFGAYTTFDHRGIDLTNMPDGIYSIHIAVSQAGASVIQDIQTPENTSFWDAIDSSLVKIDVSRNGGRLTKRPLVSSTSHTAHVEVTKTWSSVSKIHLEGYFLVPGVPAESFDHACFFLIIRDVNSKNVNRVVRFAAGNKSDAGRFIDDPWLDYSKGYFATPNYDGIDVSFLASGQYELLITAIFRDSVFSQLLSSKLVVDLTYGVVPQLKKPSVGVIGACVSRGNFSSAVVPDWKSYFCLHGDQYQMSFLSFMADPVDVLDDAFSDLDRHSALATSRDFLKSYRFELLRDFPDVLVIDFFSDARFGCIEYGGSLVTNNEWKLHNSDLYSELDDVRNISMRFDEHEYLRLFLDASRRFEDLRSTYFPNTKIVLNSARAVSSRIENGVRKLMTPSVNRELNGWWSQLDQAFLGNVSVDAVIAMPNSIQGNSLHAWGAGSVHYEQKYYADFRRQLLDALSAKSHVQIV